MADKMSVEIEKRETDTDPPITVYQVNIEDGQDGSWCEAFATEVELYSFLRGIRVAYAMSSLKKYLSYSDFNERVLTFTEKDCEEALSPTVKTLQGEQLD